MSGKKRRSAFSVKTTESPPRPEISPTPPSAKNKKKRKRRNSKNFPITSVKSGTKEIAENHENGSFLDVSQQAEISATDIFKKMKKEKEIPSSETVEEDSGMAEQVEDEKDQSEMKPPKVRKFPKK